MSAFSKRKLCFFLGVGIALYGAFVFYGDAFLLFIASFGALLIAACGIAIAFAIQFIALGARPWSHLVIVRFAALGGIAVVMLLAAPVSLFIELRATADTKAFPDLVAPLLEQYR